MKYLFFDIECAATYKGGYTPIYSFGYVLSDDEFNVIKQEDIIINPRIKRSKWMKHVYENFLAYDIELVESNYIFSNKYKSIKELLENKDHYSFFFAVNNDDITYLNNECDRYEKDYFKFNAVNVCELIKKILGRPSKSLVVEYANCYCEDKYVLEVLNIAKSASLDELSTEFYTNILKIDKSIHRSDYDAYLTMKVVEYLYKLDKEKFIKVLNNIKFIANQYVTV